MAYLVQLGALTDELVAAVATIPEVRTDFPVWSFRFFADADSRLNKRDEMPAASLRCAACGSINSSAQITLRSKID